jgi:3-dehydroquinate synthase
MTTPEARVPVHLGPRSYDVVIGAGTLGALPVVISSALSGTPRRAILACDDGLPTETSATAERSLAAAGITALRFGLEASEEHKSLDQLAQLLAFLAAHRIERTEPLIALGGGIVGDLAGFAAATYRRGIPFIQCPTTLLSMVDASVGGKTGVNLPGPGKSLLKNMVGAFHQPRAVVIDVRALDSLPERSFRAGLAECVKHAMIGAECDDLSLGDWTANHLAAILIRDPATLTSLIARNVRIKATIVERDEREEQDQGGRALLNLGHTFAHAIETLPTLSPDANPGHAPLQHGEAVALGLLAAAATSEAAGHATSPQIAQTAALISTCGLPSRVAGLPPSTELLARMAHDKKVQGGKLRLILPVAPGRAAVFAGVPEPAITAGWDAIRA